MPGMLLSFDRRQRWDSNFRDVPEPHVVERCDSLSLLPKPITLPELLNADGRSHIRQVVFITGGDDLIVPGAFGSVPFPGIFTDPMETHDTHPLCPLGIISCRHTTFTCG